MFSWLVRIAAYILAAVALIRLMQGTGIVQFQPFFIAWLDNMRQLLEVPFLFDALQRFVIDPTLNYIRSFGWHLPELQGHWRQLFVLTWLLTAAVTRNINFENQRISELELLTRIILGFVVTLPFCVGAGLMPLGFGALLLAVSACFTALNIPFLFAGHTRHVGGWRAAAFKAAWIAVIVIFAIVSPQKTEPAVLLILAGLLALVAASLLLTGVFYYGGKPSERLSHQFSVTGLDIFAAMSLAFAAVVFLSEPPLVAL